MVEQVLNFGLNNELSGILTQPDPEFQKKHVPSVIFLNSGILHKTGFNRFNTDMARCLSHTGYSSLRFDLHGLGDSTACHPSVNCEKQVDSDIHQAIDLLTDISCTHNCIIIGLCSGADFAHAAATIDKRITGLILLDGYAYRTFGFLIRDYGPIFLNPYRLIRFVARKIMKKMASLNSSSKYSYQINPIYLRSFPPKNQIIKDLQGLINRKTRLFYIYSGGIPAYYNYANQFLDMFRSVNFKGMVSHYYFKEADHTYTIISLRQRLIKIISDWILNTYP